MHTDKLALPIGVDNFTELRQRGCCFVDKSMFLYEIMQNSAKANLILRPRHSGKSVDLDMLRQFLAIDGDPSLFDGLQILQAQDFCRHHMGQYPVLYLNLKTVDAEDFDAACDQLAQLLSEVAQSMPYLAASEKLSEYNHTQYDRILHLVEQGASRSMVELESAPYNLTGMLQRHYGKRVVVLIDEYDVPLYRAHLHGYGNRMDALIHDMLHQLLKGNESLDFGVVMGCLRLPRAGVCSGLNNLVVMNRSYDFRGQYFAFTEEETTAVLAYYGISEKMDELREWYGRSNPDGTVVYSPQDVCAFVDCCVSGKAADPEQDWTGARDILKELLSRCDGGMLESYVELVCGGKLRYEISDDLAYGDRDYGGPDIIMSLLAVSGCLDGAEEAEEDAGEWDMSWPEYSHWAANRKVRWQLADALQEWLQEQCGVQAGWMEQFNLAIEQGDCAAMKSTLDMILAAVYEAQEKRQEWFRRDDMFSAGALLGLLPSSRTLQGEIFWEEGFVSVSFRSGDGQGVVLALRELSDGELQEGCAEAMRHMEEIGYAKTLLEQGAAAVQCYGIAVQYNQCAVQRKLYEW